MTTPSTIPTTTVGTAAAVDVPTWSPRRVLGVWAAAAVPMALMAWVAGPALARTFSGPTAMPRALILTLTAGMIWQFALVMIVVRREQGSLRWAVLKEALWLRAPTSPVTGRRGGRLWLMIIPLVVLLGLEELLPTLPTPAARDLTIFFGSDAGQAWMSGNWGWYVLMLVMFVFNTALGEELLFRGLLLPRMAAFGRADWLVNGVLFATYHLHEPWVIPQTVLVDTFAEAWPSRRYRSSLIGIAVHSSQTVFFAVIATVLVLR
jgi:uncharacterized protein